MSKSDTQAITILSQPRTVAPLPQPIVLKAYSYPGFALCCNVADQPIFARAEIDRLIYCPGDKITVKLWAFNASNRLVTTFRTKLSFFECYYGSDMKGRTKKVKNVASSSAKMDLRSGLQTTNFELHTEIPSNVPPTHTSLMIGTMYYLNVYVETTWETANKLRFPIQIVDRPAQASTTLDMHPGQLNHLMYFGKYALSQSNANDVTETYEDYDTLVQDCLQSHKVDDKSRKIIG